MTGPITALLDSGFDAFTNLYDVVIEPPTALSAVANLRLTGYQPPEQNELAVRAQDFTPVTLDVGTYPVHYKTSSLTRPNAKFEGERRFTLSFREDAAYQLLELFQAWKHLYADPSNETRITYGALGTSEIFGAGEGMASESYYGKIKIYAYKSEVGTTSNVSTSVDALDAAGNVGASWFYNQCMVIKVTPPAYTRESSGPATFTVDFLYGKMSEPGGAAIDAGITTAADSTNQDTDTAEDVGVIDGVI